MHDRRHRVTVFEYDRKTNTVRGWTNSYHVARSFLQARDKVRQFGQRWEFEMPVNYGRPVKEAHHD